MRRRVPVAAADLSGQRPGGDGPGPQADLLNGLQRRWLYGAASAGGGWQQPPRSSQLPLQLATPEPAILRHSPPANTPTALSTESAT